MTQDFQATSATERVREEGSRMVAAGSGKHKEPSTFKGREAL